ncbi:MAG: hypothetical protein HRF45_01425 [Fimbriimonadia bacterium]|jgi:hypothetical protein
MLSASLVKWGLLLFVGASLAYLGLGGGNPQSTQSTSSPGPTQQTEIRAPDLMLYYFHRTQRCPTCLKIEDLTGQIVQEVYAKELESGRLVYQVINVDDPGNDSFIREYELISSSLIAARFVKGKRAEWKSLDDVWLLTSDPAKFRDYLTRKIDVMLAAAKK